MSTPDTIDDLQSVIDRAQLGSEKAMSQLFDLYYDRIAQYAFRRVLDYDDTQDITAQVFLNVVKNLHRFKWRHMHSFSGWIFRIASNEVNQHLRRSKHKVAVDGATLEGLSGDRDRTEGHRKTVEQELDLTQEFVALHAAIAQLKDKQQNLIHLHYFEHLTHKEIAIALSMREGAARVAVHRAVAELRKHATDKAELTLGSIES